MNLKTILIALFFVVGCDDAPNLLGDLDAAASAPRQLRLRHINTLETGGQTEIVHFAPGSNTQAFYTMP